MRDGSLQRETTVGEALASVPMTLAVAGVGLLLVAVGSIGPWATVLAISVSGTHGDGKITLGLAVFAALLVMVRHRAASVVAGLAALAAAAVSVYDLVHIEHVTSGLTVFGAHLASAGWGVYVAAGGALMAALAILGHVTASSNNTQA